MSDERLVPRYDDEGRSYTPPPPIPHDLEPNTQVSAPRNNALEVVDFGDDAGAGGQDLGLDELLTPFLRMLQGLSPEINPMKPEHILGAQLGMIVNTASKELYDGREGLDIVVCDRAHHYGKWVPRDLGGGFRGIAPMRDPLVLSALARVGGNKFRLPRYRDGRWVAGKGQAVVDPIIDPESNDPIELVETGQFYVLYAPHGQLLPETAQRAVLSMTSTAMPKYMEFVTRWNSWVYPQPDGRSLPAPLWAYKYRLRTVADRNDLGEFFNWSTRLLPEGAAARDGLMQRDDPLYVMGKSFYELVQSGKVAVDYEKSASTGTDEPPF